MKCVGGIWIPDGEVYLVPHLTETPGFADRYDADLFAFVSALPVRRLAIDVGGSIGLWSRKLAPLFQCVHAFEPLAEARDCFQRNVEAVNVALYPLALGERIGTTQIFPNGPVGFKTHVKGDSGPIELRTLDSYGFEGVDFLKIDCEGFDYFVLKGAEATIVRERPLVIFEAKQNVSNKRYRIEQRVPHQFMESLGYEVRHELRGNVICYPNGGTP